MQINLATWLLAGNHSHQFIFSSSSDQSTFQIALLIGLGNWDQQRENKTENNTNMFSYLPHSFHLYKQTACECVCVSRTELVTFKGKHLYFNMLDTCLCLFTWAAMLNLLASKHKRRIRSLQSATYVHSIADTVQRFDYPFLYGGRGRCGWA